MYRKKTVLFDFDGIIADSEYYYYQAYNKAFEKRGHSIDEHEYYHYFSSLGLGIANEVKRYNLDISENEQKIMYQERLIHFTNFCKQGKIKFFEQIHSILSYFINNKFDIAIASNSYENDLNYILQSNEYSNPDFPVIGRKPGLRSKPEPDIFIYAAGVLNVQPKDCIVIEDAEKGLNAAKKVGMKCVIIRNRYNKNIEFKNADIIFESHNSFYEDLVSNKLNSFLYEEV